MGPGAYPGRSLGHVECHQELSGGSWGKRARDWSVPRGGLETELGDPRGKGMMARYTISHIFPGIFYDFQKQYVFQRRAPGALMIFNDK